MVNRKKGMAQGRLFAQFNHNRKKKAIKVMLRPRILHFKNTFLFSWPVAKTFAIRLENIPPSETFYKLSEIPD